MSDARTITRMVRTTPEEDAQIMARALPGEAPAVAYRRLALSGGAPDCDPRIVEVTLRSPGGHVDGVVGVYTLSIAAGMIALRRAAGWTASYRIVAEQPKVGGELPDPAAQVNALTLDEIIAARLRDDERTAKRKP
jgi:hypothetical protein